MFLPSVVANTHTHTNAHPRTACAAQVSRDPDYRFMATYELSDHTDHLWVTAFGEAVSGLCGSSLSSNLT